MTFDDLNLAPALLQAVREQGYTVPTPIQAQAIPIVMQGHDLLGGAQTGTGKTAAFTLPLLHRLSLAPAARSRFGGKGVRVLVLTPTRELAAQVEESVRIYGQHLPLTSTVIFGGVGMNPQIERLREGVDILVATPGRLLDLQDQGRVDLSTVQILVLDEADRMLDMGFIHDVKKILALMPAEKQSLLFSATFSDEIRALAQGLLRNPQEVQVTPRNTTVQRIAQTIHPVGRNRKKDLLAHVITQHQWSQVLVFTRTKFGANQVADFLNTAGISAMALHGNKSQAARTEALGQFKAGELRVLVATDIAARGIDIEDLPHVVNFDIPNVPEDYVHRIGRTGRAGSEGQAVSFVCLDEEGFMQGVERFTRQEIPVQIIDGFGAEEGEQAEPIAMGRQVLWGGAGRPPSREAMNAAAKAARSEMFERIRERKATEGAGRTGGGGGGGNGSGGDANRRSRNKPRNRPNGQRRDGPPRAYNGPAPDGQAFDGSHAEGANHAAAPMGEGSGMEGAPHNGAAHGHEGQGPRPPRHNGPRQGGNGNRNDNRDRNGYQARQGGNRPPRDPNAPRPERDPNAPQTERGDGYAPRADRGDGYAPRPDRGDSYGPRTDRGPRAPRDPDALPAHIDPLKTNNFAARRDRPPRPTGPAGQPDPMRTSIDSMRMGKQNQKPKRKPGAQPDPLQTRY